MGGSLPGRGFGVGASVLSLAAGGIGIVELRRGRTRPSSVESVIEPARMFSLGLTGGLFEGWHGPIYPVAVGPRVHGLPMEVVTAILESCI